MMHSQTSSCFLFVGCLFGPFCLAHRLTYKFMVKALVKAAKIISPIGQRSSSILSEYHGLIENLALAFRRPRMFTRSVRLFPICHVVT